MGNYKPFNFQEEVLVQQIADSWHRIGRCREIETSTIDLGTTQFFCQHQFDETPGAHNAHNERLALGYAFEHKGDQLCRLRRYETAIERSYYRAIQQLTRMQELRKKQEKLIGSVSQKDIGAHSAAPLVAAAGGGSFASSPSPKPQSCHLVPKSPLTPEPAASIPVNEPSNVVPIQPRPLPTA